MRSQASHGRVDNDAFHRFNVGRYIAEQFVAPLDARGVLISESRLAACRGQQLSNGGRPAAL